MIHKTGLKKRFPSLPNDIISSSWSGVVSRSSNGSQIFEKLNETSFLEVNNKYFIQNDVHFNKKGNQAIANLITKHFDYII